jgi:ATP-dependent DNA helicase DinG
LSWETYFPLASWREAQKEALDFIVECFDAYDDIFVEAPTGIGKSAVAIAIGRWRSDRNESTFIGTATVALENQYMGDFARIGLKQLHSKSWYRCPECDFCDLGSAQIKVTNGTRKRCTECNCTYEIAKSAFFESKGSISNYAFLLANARFVKSFVPRELAVFDEAHLLHETISSAYEIQILSRDVEYFPDEGGELEWIQYHYSDWLGKQIRELDEEFQDLSLTDPHDPDLNRLFKKLESAQRKYQNLEKFLQDDPKDWVFDLQEDRLKILPIWGKKLAQELLPRIARKRIYLSATLPAPKLQARYLGIDPLHAAFLCLGSPFPVENRLIYICPIICWDYKNPEPAIAMLCRIIERILKRFPLDRGLIHVSSYYQARQIVECCRNPRLITHENARHKETQLDAMFARPGSVLVSPSSHEGLDLYGDRSRFQIIAKLPFASLGDKRVKRRMRNDNAWYTLHTAQKLIQAAGRSIRSDTDYATTYILDAAFTEFKKRADKFFPQYFKDSFREISQNDL